MPETIDLHRDLTPTDDPCVCMLGGTRYASPAFEEELRSAWVAFGLKPLDANPIPIGDGVEANPYETIWWTQTGRREAIWRALDEEQRARYLDLAEAICAEAKRDPDLEAVALPEVWAGAILGEGATPEAIRDLARRLNGILRGPVEHVEIAVRAAKAA